jgi:hypothetical protein
MNEQRLQDPRGHLHRIKRLMADDDARAFLRTQKVAHAATVDVAGWPYVVPLIYIYEGGDQLYVHTGNHGGHFQRNIESHPRMCIEAAAVGPVHRGHPFACNSALVYTSVIVLALSRSSRIETKRPGSSTGYSRNMVSPIGRLSRAIGTSIALSCMSSTSR